MLNYLKGAAVSLVIGTGCWIGRTLLTLLKAAAIVTVAFWMVSSYIEDAGEYVIKSGREVAERASRDKRTPVQLLEAERAKTKEVIEGLRAAPVPGKLPAELAKLRKLDRELVAARDEEAHPERKAQAAVDEAAKKLDALVKRKQQEVAQADGNAKRLTQLDAQIVRFERERPEAIASAARWGSTPEAAGAAVDAQIRALQTNRDRLLESTVEGKQALADEIADAEQTLADAREDLNLFTAKATAQR